MNRKMFFTTPKKEFYDVVDDDYDEMINLI